jgi:hypothetical protein
MKPFSSHKSGDSFRARVFGKPEISIVVRLFGLYLAVPVTVLLAGGAAVGLYFVSKIPSRPSTIWLQVVGLVLLLISAVGVNRTGRALQTGRRWGIWATMFLCLLASITTMGIFNERERWGGQVGSAIFFALVLPALVAFIVSVRNFSAFQPLEGTAARRARVAFKWGIPAAIFFMAVGYAGVNLLVARYEQSVNARWAAHGIRPDEIPIRFPRTEANQTARMLANMAATDYTCKRIGTYGFSKLVDPKSPDAKALGFIELQQPPFKKGWAILEELQKKPGDDIGDMPADVTEYLDKHHPVLDRMYAAIRAQSPQWEMDVARGVNEPVPDFLVCRSIVNLICLDALNHLRKGEKEQALAELDCAWRIASACSARPEMTGQGLSWMCEQTIFLTLRKFNDVPPEWHERLSDRDRMNRFRTSLACEAYKLSADVKRFGIRGLDWEYDEKYQPVLWKRALFSLSRPLARYWVAEISGSYLTGLERIEKYNECSLVFEPFQGLHSSMNMVGEFSLSARGSFGAVFRLNDYWTCWMKYRFDSEMTNKLLKVKEAASGGPVPLNVDGLDSSICPDAKWELESTPGAFSLTFSRKVPVLNNDQRLSEDERKGLFRIQWPWMNVWPPGSAAS